MTRAYDDTSRTSDRHVNDLFDVEITGVTQRVPYWQTDRSLWSADRISSGPVAAKTVSPRRTNIVGSGASPISFIVKVFLRGARLRETSRRSTTRNEPRSTARLSEIRTSFRDTNRSASG